MKAFQGVAAFVCYQNVSASTTKSKVEMEKNMFDMFHGLGGNDAQIDMLLNANGPYADLYEAGTKGAQKVKARL